MRPREVVEYFHLAFVRALFVGLPDKSLVAVKGGINLRFWFASPRFSEDLDLDVNTIARATLENRIDRLLTHQLTAVLKSKQLLLRDITKPKRTETAQKWKLSVVSTETATETRTKIEFSRRDDVVSAVLEPVGADLAKHYGATSFRANHYQTADAVRQKVHALMDRKEPQPRDVFDLNVLLARQDAPEKLDDEAASWIDQAIEHAMDLTYEQYDALIVSYLEREHIEQFGSRESWELMQNDVVTRLEALKR